RTGIVRAAFHLVPRVALCPVVTAAHGGKCFDGVDDHAVLHQRLPESVLHAMHGLLSVGYADKRLASARWPGCYNSAGLVAEAEDPAGVDDAAEARLVVDAADRLQCRSSLVTVEDRRQPIEVSVPLAGELVD